MCSVKRGGIKKKFQIKALNIAAVSTGNNSRKIAQIETVTSKISATTLYPSRSEIKKQAKEIAKVPKILIKYCLRRL